MVTLGSVQYAPVLHRNMSGWHVTLLNTSHWTVARECIINTLIDEASLTRLT